jgi:hypothetical protein
VPTTYVSLPVPPVRVFVPELPVSTLSSALPVALMAELPVSERFSTFAPSVQVTDD